jgi:hypothetical protein
MDDNKRINVLKGKDIEKIANACNRYPIITMEFKEEHTENE